jgi:DNA-binding NarL/FixJ family response regulator
MEIAVIAKDILVCDSLVSVISNQGGVKGVGGARTVSQATRMLDHGGVLVVVGDGLGVEDWIEIGRAKADGATKILLVVTDGEETSGRSAADAVVHSREGANGLVRATKNLMGEETPAIAGTGMVRETGVAYGRRGRSLTKREREVASYVSLGMSNRRISQILGLQEQSIKNLVSSIMRKLDCQNRTQVVLKLTGKPYDNA